VHISGQAQNEAHTAAAPSVPELVAALLEKILLKLIGEE